MKKAISKFFKNLYWTIYKLTPAGKKAYVLEQAFSGIKIYTEKQNTVKQNVIKTAGKILSSKKILNFHKGKSITKSKKTNFETLKQASAQHQQELKDAGLAITHKGKFVNA